MADIPKQTIVENDGLSVTYAAAANGDTIAAFDVRDEFIVKTAGTAVDVTLSSNQNCDQGFDHNHVESIGATAEYHFRLKPAARWKNATTGKLEITYSVLTAVTVACIRHPR